jgi:hypothetical protein
LNLPVGIIPHLRVRGAGGGGGRES